MNENVDTKLKEDLDLMTNPTRLSIVLLLEKENTMFTREIAKTLDIEESLTRYHLKQLRKRGFIESEAELLEDRTQAVNQHRVTEKVKEMKEFMIAIATAGQEGVKDFVKQVKREKK